MNRPLAFPTFCGLALAGLFTFSGAFAKDEAAPASGPEVTLKARLNPGKTYTVRQVMTSDMELPLGGAGKAHTTIEYEMKMAVGAEGEGGNKNVKVSTGGFKMKMDMGATSMEYDATDPAKQNPLLKGMMGQMAEKTFEATFDKNDKIVEEKKGGKKAPAAPGMMGMTLGDEEVRQIMNSLVDHGFPEHPVKPGDKWKHRMDSAMSQMGAFAMEMEYEYVGEAEYDGHPCVELKVVGGKAPAAPAKEGAPAPIMELAKAAIDGTVLFDNKEGVARQTEMSMDMTMSAGGAELPMASKVTSSLVGIGKTE